MLLCIYVDVGFNLPQMAEMIEAGTRDSVNLLFHEKHPEVMESVHGLQNDVVDSDSPITS